MKKRGEEKKKRRRRRRREERYGNYVWMAMFLYGTCMEVFVWILVVPFLGFS